MNKEIEKILSASVFYNGINFNGKNHAKCIERLHEIYPDVYVSQEMQGFLTTDNRFVDRKEGAEIAYKAGQTIRKLEVLYSEDLDVDRRSYIQGVKDMAEVVRVEEEQPDLTGNLTISDIASITGYSKGFSGAVRAINSKAQQFINSLEKEDGVK